MSVDILSRCDNMVFSLFIMLPHPLVFIQNRIMFLLFLGHYVIKHCVTYGVITLYFIYEKKIRFFHQKHLIRVAGILETIFLQSTTGVNSSKRI